VPRGREDEERLTADIIALARLYGRYGYRKITALLRAAGWLVNDKRVERIWKREGLKVPPKQPKRGRLWLHDGSCIRLRPEHPNHVWSYDFVEDRTHDGRKSRLLNVIDEFSHECLAIRVARKLRTADVIDVLSDLFILRGVPGHIRSDNGAEFVAKAVQAWVTYGTSCSMARSSTRCERRRSSSRVGGAITMRCARTPHWATAHRRPRCSFQRLPRGRRRKLGRLCRPRSRWRPDQLSTNIRPGPPVGGRSLPRPLRCW
jgi:hypothetical protein